MHDVIYFSIINVFCGVIYFSIIEVFSVVIYFNINNLFCGRMLQQNQANRLSCLQFESSLSVVVREFFSDIPMWITVTSST